MQRCHVRENGGVWEVRRDPGHFPYVSFTTKEMLQAKPPRQNLMLQQKVARKYNTAKRPQGRPFRYMRFQA